MKKALLLFVFAIQFIGLAGVASKTSTSEVPLPQCYPCPDGH